jgi:hypothetical protein
VKNNDDIKDDAKRVRREVKSKVDEKLPYLSLRIPLPDSYSRVSEVKYRILDRLKNYEWEDSVKLRC